MGAKNKESKPRGISKEPVAKQAQPKTWEMIKGAFDSSKKKKISRAAIAKYVTEQYKISPSATFTSLLRRTLKQKVQGGELSIDGQSFKLNKPEKKPGDLKSTKKKQAEKKPTGKKQPIKKPAAVKESKPSESLAKSTSSASTKRNVSKKEEKKKEALKVKKTPPKKPVKKKAVAKKMIFK